MKTLMKAVSLILLLTVQSFSIADVEIKADIVYGHKAGMALTYDVFQPQSANGAGIIFMISGGWFSRWTEPENRLQGYASMLDAGFTVFAVHHGSAPRFKVPEAYADVSRAVRHIRLHAEDYGVDSDRMGVTGGSAGGHLSLMLGLNSDKGDMNGKDPLLAVSNEVAAVVAYYPPVDLRSITGPNDRFPALDYPQDQAASISPILFADRADPPTLLIHGDSDGLVNISNSVIMQAEFEKQGVVSNFITIPGADHGFRGEDAAEASAARLAWFQKYLLP